MGHSLEQLGTAALDTMAGLITFASAQDLPEGASPRNWDVDYIVGSVFTRAGLQSVYTYANTLSISQLVVYNSIGTFTYSGITPTINEVFTLSEFSGNALFLNGLQVAVLSVTPTTFTVELDTSSATYSGLSGIAVSSIGNFVGPNAPTIAFSVATSGGNAWTNPEGVLGSVTYASAVSGSSLNSQKVPSEAGNITSSNPAWSNPENILSASQVASVALTAQSSQSIMASGMTFPVPSDATITGIVVSLSASSTVAGVGSVNVQLTDANTLTPVGTPVNVPLSTVITSRTVGSSQYQWGTTLTPDVVRSLGILVSGQVSSGTSTITAHALTVTVYFTLAGATQQLQVSGFAFALPSTAGITGLGISFQAFSTADTTLSFQFMKNGIAVGTPQTQALTATPTVYSIGAANDLWGSTFTFSDVNNVDFGVLITATGGGTSSINDLDVLAYITPSLVNFNYVKTYEQDNGQTYTLALDASGLIWEENVTEAPGILYIAYSGIIPGSFAMSATADSNEYICFSDLAVGTDRPRVYNGVQFLPLSQVGPGAPPIATASQGNSTTNVLFVLTWNINNADSIITWTYNPATFEAQAGDIYVVQGLPASLNINGKAVVVVSGGLAPGTFETSIPAGVPDGTGTGSGVSGGPTLTIAEGYIIANILESAPAGVQNGATPFNGQEALLSAGPNSIAPGNTITYWYGTGGGAPDPTLLAAFNTGLDVYVYLDASTPFYPSQTVKVINMGSQVPPDQGGVGNLQYFTVAWTGAAAAQGYLTPQNVSWAVGPGNDGNFQVTMATLVLSAPAPLKAQDVVTIISTPGGPGTTPSGWNGIWTITQALNSGTLNILSESSTGNGTITYTYTSATEPPITVTAGETVSIIGSTGPAYTNGTFTVSSATGSGGSGSFNVSNPAATTSFTSDEPSGVPAIGTVFGTEFLFDPGINAAGLGSAVANPIIGPPNGSNYTPDSATLTIAGSPFTGVGSGTRQVVCFFITETEYFTAPSPTFTFNVSGNSTYVAITHLPIGPPNVIARGLAFTEAGQFGVAGANFYYIPEEVTQTVNGVTTVLANSTVINDNVTSNINLVFTDAVLLDSVEIDIQGNDLFNLIELGSSAWVVPYSSRNFYGMQLNKVTEFNNLSFDGGFLSNNSGGTPSYSVVLLGGTFSNLQPLGWTTINTVDQTLAISPVTGDALYIKNTYGTQVNTSQIGMIYQDAYQDSFSVPIIAINTTYSVRLAASIPSGIPIGSLMVDLTDYSNGSFGHTYGTFSVPLSSMSTDMQVFTGTLLTSPFPLSGTNFSGVSPNLQLRVWAQGLGVNADVLIDRIEVFPTKTPYLLAQVYGSYVDDPEAIDASDNGGIIDTSTENAQTCYGGFVMHDNLFLLKQASMYATENNPNSEPGGWSLREVSNRVGACGIHAYDTGEEWAIMACRAGIFGFNGGQPVKLSLEIFNLWDLINWDAANTIVLRNDINNKRFYCWIPLPTGTNPETGVATSTVLWLPNAPYNPSPTTPNVCLMCNYQGLDTAQELFNGPGVHTTMFGALAAVDMKRKWSIWNIPCPYADFIFRQDGVDDPLFVCNGIMSSKIYEFEDNQLSDDGVAINSLYTTYGHVNAVKAATQPIFGMHTKRYTILQVTAEGAGTMGVRILPNVITPKYPYSVPVGITLSSPSQDDYFRPINVKAQRAFLEFSTNAVGSWFHLDKSLLTGKADPWSSLNPTGGGNAGISN